MKGTGPRNAHLTAPTRADSWMGTFICACNRRHLSHNVNENPIRYLQPSGSAITAAVGQVTALNRYPTASSLTVSCLAEYSSPGNPG